MEKNNNYDDIMYQLHRQAVIIYHNSILLIINPSDELVELAYKSYMSKIISGLPIKLNGKMMVLFGNYESNILKQKMMNKRKYSEFINI